MNIIETIDYQFKNPALLESALTHSSYSHENGLNDTENNQRLEFLGDAVLELVMSDLLYHRYPALSEGKLTRRRAELICEPSLASIARGLSLGQHLKLGYGEERSGGRKRDSILADTMEALFGAVYLDGGLAPVKDLIRRLFASTLENEESHLNDFKTTLQELVQVNSRESAVYKIIHEEGPPHRKVFTAACYHQGEELGVGTGQTKKEAEQQAAKSALEVFRRKK